MPGANGLLGPADVDAAAAGGAFAASRVLLTQLEVPLAATLSALRHARAAGLTTVFNAAPAPTSPLPDELWPLVDVFCPNETEAALVTGLPTKTLAEVLAVPTRAHLQHRNDSSPTRERTNTHVPSRSQHNPTQHKARSTSRSVLLFWCVV